MLFNSVGFMFVFLPAFLLALFVAPRGRARSLVLLLFSYLFYSGAEPFFLLILLLSSVTDYGAALRIEASRGRLARRAWLLVSLTINLGVLAVYKYGTWIVAGLEPWLAARGIPAPNTDFLHNYVLPAGISFYTFQSMSYTIDVFRGEIRPQRGLLGFCNYVAYLPQLIAGPIERFAHLHPQLDGLTRGEVHYHWSAGLDRIALGLAQKLLLADSCGIIVDRLVQGGSGDFITAWAIALGFGMQIYYDFAAYTHIAIGISLLLGVRLSENFFSPYKAVSIRDFWRRWHMTLSNWFRDYLYIPLGGSRKGVARTVFNVLVTFLLVGLWHGAGWNYVVWGALHGAMLGAYHVKQTLFPAWRLHPALAVFVTFVAVHFAWVPFRLADTAQVADVWAGMLGLHGLGASPVSAADLVFLALVIAGTLVFPNAAQRWPGARGWVESAAIVAVALFAILSTPETTKFIYFQF